MTSFSNDTDIMSPTTTTNVSSCSSSTAMNDLLRLPPIAPNNANNNNNKQAESSSKTCRRTLRRQISASNKHKDLYNNKAINIGENNNPCILPSIVEENNNHDHDNSNNNNKCIGNDPCVLPSITDANKLGNTTATMATPIAAISEMNMMVPRPPSSQKRLSSSSQRSRTTRCFKRGGVERQNNTSSKSPTPFELPAEKDFDTGTLFDILPKVRDTILIVIN